MQTAAPMCAKRAMVPLSNRLLLARIREPPPVLGTFSADYRVECVLNTTRHRPRFTAADHVTVHFADRRHFDRRPREEEFVGVIHVLDRDRRDARRNPEIVSFLRNINPTIEVYERTASR